MKLTIRSIVANDLDSIIDLMREFAEHEGLMDYLEITVDDLREVLFGPRAYVESLVGTVDDIPVGYTIFYQTFSSFRGQQSVYLEDIFVSKGFRNKGVGEKMLIEVAKHGKALGASRMDFQVLDGNESAIAFYKSRGALMDKHERPFKFVDGAFEDLVK